MAPAPSKSPSGRFGGDARQLLVAVEALSTEIFGRLGIASSPALLKQALEADVAERRSHVPSAHECSMLVDAVASRLEPAWFTERWPRTLGTVQNIAFT